MESCIGINFLFANRNQDEIVFTIKMTKEEYMQFLQTKAAKGK